MYRIGRLRLYIAIIVAFLLESTFFSLIKFGDARPNLILILVIFVGLHSDWEEALEAGVVGGLLRGVLGGGLSGVNLIVLGLCGLFASYCKSKLFKENFITQIILTLSAALAFNALTLFARMITRSIEPVGLDLWRALIFSVFILSLYTSLFSPPAFFCLKKLLKVKY